jgi:hypothetical protein
MTIGVGSKVKLTEVAIASRPIVRYSGEKGVVVIVDTINNQYSVSWERLRIQNVWTLEELIEL